MAAPNFDAAAMMQQMGIMQQAMVDMQTAHAQQMVDAGNRQTHLESVVQAHQHQVGALEAAAAAAPHQGGGYRGSGMRIPAPAAYDGNATTIETWVSAMRQQFAYHRATHDETEMVHMASGVVKGPALDWLNSLVSPPATWVEFESGLRARFQPVTSEQMARNKLDALEQGKMSINDYVSYFRRLMACVSTMDKASQMHCFVRGLKSSLQTIHHQQQPRSLEDAIGLAMRMGMTDVMMKHPSQGQDTSAPSAMDLSALLTSGDPTSEAAVARVELFAMIAAMQGRNNKGGTSGTGGGYQPRGLPVINGLTAKQVKEYMDAEQCFNCHEVGHRSRQCPKKRGGNLK